MAASLPCPRCGYQNEPGWTFCTNCGGALSAAAPSSATGTAPGPSPLGYPAAPAPPVTYPYVYGPAPWQVEWARQVDRTKTGLLLLLVGSLLSWIPFGIGLLGSLLILIGAILVILGRRAFGDAHRRNVVLSIVLFVIGIAVAVVGAIFAVLIAFSPIITSGTEAQIAAALRDGFRNAMTIAIVGSLISGLASVFFTYALQKREGRILLWGAYAATVGVSIATLLLLLPVFDVLATELAREIVSQGSSDPSRIAAVFSGAGVGPSLLNVIPAVLFAGAAYLAWSRINRREIPVAPGVASGPTGPQPPMYPPPRTP